jgi:zinc protease
MKRILHPAALFALLLAAPAAARPQAPPDPFRGLERRVLPNGLTVLALEDRRLPRAAAVLALRTGSAHDPEGLSGMAHYLEHMVFKGTRSHKPGDIDLLTLRHGGENNGYTDPDVTTFWFRVHPDGLEPVLDLLAEILGACTLDAAELERERGPVLRELEAELDDPWGALEPHLAASLYREGGYRIPTLGRPEDVRRITRDSMAAFYKAHYVPPNAVLALVGDFDKDRAFRAVEARFAPLPRGAEPPPAPAPRPGEGRDAEISTASGADRLAVAFRGPPGGSDDDILLDLLAALLGEGRSSRLSSRLVYHEGLAPEGGVHAANESRRRGGVFTIRVELALDAPLEAVRDAVLEEIERLRAEPPSERELRRARNLLRSRWLFDAESADGRAMTAAWWEALGRPDYVNRYLSRLETATPEAVSAAARRYLAPENRAVGVSRRKAKRSPGPRTARALQAAPSWAAAHEERLENGLAVVVQPRPGTGVLAVRAFVEAGPLFEPEEKAGVAFLTGDLLDEAIEDDDGRRLCGEDLAAPLEFAGGEFFTDAEGVSVRIPAEHAARAFDLVRDVLRYPSFPEELVRARREDLLARIETQDDDPRDAARRLFFREAYRGHPLARPETGFKQTVEKLTRADVQAHYERFFRPENTILAVAGDIDPARAVAEIRARLGSWRGRGEWTRPRVPEARRQEEPRRAFLTHPSELVWIHLGHAGPLRTHPDHAALRVLETILCSSPGFTNRLAARVRESLGLSYEVGGSVTLGAGPAGAPFEIVLGVRPEDKDRALAAVREVLEKFVEEGPTAREVEDARRYLVGSQARAWETSEEAAASLVERLRFGLGRDEAARIAAVSPEDVRRAARRHLDPRALTVAVVGPVDARGEPLREGK